MQSGARSGEARRTFQFRVNVPCPGPEERADWLDARRALCTRSAAPPQPSARLLRRRVLACLPMAQRPALLARLGPRWQVGRSPRASPARRRLGGRPFWLAGGRGRLRGGGSRAGPGPERGGVAGRSLAPPVARRRLPGCRRRGCACLPSAKGGLFWDKGRSRPPAEDAQGAAGHEGACDSGLQASWGRPALPASAHRKAAETPKRRPGARVSGAAPRASLRLRQAKGWRPRAGRFPLRLGAAALPWAPSPASSPWQWRGWLLGHLGPRR